MHFHYLGGKEGVEGQGIIKHKTVKESFFGFAVWFIESYSFCRELPVEKMWNTE